MTGAAPPDPAARRRAFIDFVRTHHPDVGGDPEVFRRGLDAYRSRRDFDGAAVPAAPIRVHRRRRGAGVFLDRLAAAHRRRRRPPRVR